MRMFYYKRQYKTAGDAYLSQDMKTIQVGLIMHTKHWNNMNYCTVTGVVHRRGFTLVELLVVISIIALLLSILMPALGKVRGQAQQVVCKTKMKQMGLAVSMYVNTYRRYPSRMLIPFVHPSDPEFGKGDVWFGWRGAYYITWETMLTRSRCMPSGGMQTKDSTANEIWRCPSQKNLPERGVPPWHNYGINAAFADTARENPGWSESKIRQDSGRLLIADADPYYQDPPRYYLTVPSVDADMIYFRHRGKSNVLFIDGHVGQVDKTTPGITDNASSLWNVIIR